MTEGDEAIAARFSAAGLYGIYDAERVRVEVLREASYTLEAHRFADLLWCCWRDGDSRAQRSVLRALPALREPERHLRIAAEGAHASVTSLFEAIASGNAYPARFFAERAFNQLVMKAVFLGVPVASIEGLEGRLNATLSRMAVDFAAERCAAGRAVSDDLLLLLRHEHPARESA